MLGESPIARQAHRPGRAKQVSPAKAPPDAYNLRFAQRLPKASPMEAEQLNQIASQLAQLRDREVQLRRYL